MPAGLHSPRWSPSGSTIAWLRTTKSGADAIVITNARGGSLHALTAGARSVLNFTWSPDGRRIAAVETTLATASSASRVHWMTPESDYRNTAPPQRNLYVIEVATKSERVLTRDSWSYGGPETDHDPSWSADGSRIASVRQPSPLYGDFEHAQYVTIDVRSGAIRDIVGHAFFAYPGSVPPLFAPAGDAVAFAHTWDGLLPSREDLYVGDRDVTASLDRDLWSCGAGSAQWQSTDLIAGLMDGVSIRLYQVETRRYRAAGPHVTRRHRRSLFGRAQRPHRVFVGHAHDADRTVRSGSRQGAAANHAHCNAARPAGGNDALR